MTKPSDMHPVPPAGISPKGPQRPQAETEEAGTKEKLERPRNVDKQGRQGNIRQNTTNQGHQQDR